MDNFEAVIIRKSRRSYIDQPIGSARLEALSLLIETINEKHGLSIELIEDGSNAFNSFMKSYGLIDGARTVVALKGPKNDSNLMEKLGYFGEVIVLEATKLRLGTCWIGGSYDRRSDAFRVGSDEELVCVITVGDAGPESFKEKLIHSITHRRSKKIEDMLRSDDEVPEWVTHGMKAVQRAPSAVNRQPAMFEYSGGRIKAYVDKSQMFGLVDLGIAKLHFEIGAGGSFELGNGGLFNKSV
jgi:nitroreductase